MYIYSILLHILHQREALEYPVVGVQTHQFDQRFWELMAVPRHADKMGIDPNADIASRRLRTNTWLGDLISENTRFGTILGRHGCLILFRWGYEQMFVEVTSPTHVVTFGMLDQTNFGWSMTSVLSCTQPLLKTFSDGMTRIEGAGRV